MDHLTPFLVIGARQAEQEVSGNKLVLVEPDGCVRLTGKAVAVLRPFATAVSLSAETVVICFPGAIADVARGGRVIHIDSDVKLLLPADRIDISDGPKFVAFPGVVVTDKRCNCRRQVEKIKTENGLVRICLEAVCENGASSATGLA